MHAEAWGASRAPRPPLSRGRQLWEAWGPWGSPGGSPRPGAGLLTCLRTCLPQSEEKYRCVSSSQCGPERFPGGGECSPFPLTPPKW